MNQPFGPKSPTAQAPPRGVDCAADFADVERSLIERYAHMAHSFERRSVDRILRVADVFFSFLGLVLLSPLFLIITVGIALGRGPVFYRGKRVGRAGTIFTMYKFRTLRPDAEIRLGPFLGHELSQLTKSEVTLIGRFLRLTKLDELPQLVNVLLGQMSLVGPRPIRPTFFEELCREIPQYWQRLVVRPGITGYAQLRLTREMTWSEKLAHDFEFIADRSLWLYTLIILETVFQTMNRSLGGLVRRTRAS